MNLWFRQKHWGICSWSIVREELINVCKQLGHIVHSDESIPRFPHHWIEIWWGAPQDWTWSDRDVALRVGISLSEGDQLAREYQMSALNNLKRCDILFATSRFAMRAFMEMPLDVPIYEWRLGVNPDIFRWTDRCFDDNPFRFLHLGITQFRKGSWMVPEAFIRAFTEEPVRLRIACHHPRAEMFHQLQKEYGSDGRIEFIQQEYYSPILHYDGQHILVSPHLSEGWGLCITEAMALGMPCIISRCSTPREYFNSRCGWWVEMSDRYAPVSQCLPDTSGFWRLPEVEDLVAKMRYAYEHRDECEKKGIHAAKYAQSQLTWECGARDALQVLQEMSHDK